MYFKVTIQTTGGFSTFIVLLLIWFDYCFLNCLIVMAMTLIKFGFNMWYRNTPFFGLEFVGLLLQGTSFALWLYRMLGPAILPEGKQWHS